MACRKNNQRPGSVIRITSGQPNSPYSNDIVGLLGADENNDLGLPRFLAELKRRKVYRVALVYAGVGWAILEASGMVLPRLALPDWTVNVVLAVVLLGFPLALVFAWIFDISPEGIVRTEPLSPDSHHRFSFVRIAEFVLIVALVAVVGGLYVDRLSLQRELAESKSAVQGNQDIGQLVIPRPEQYRSIAVLPFADMSEKRTRTGLRRALPRNYSWHYPK